MAIKGFCESARCRWSKRPQIVSAACLTKFPCQWRCTSAAWWGGALLIGIPSLIQGQTKLRNVTQWALMGLVRRCVGDYWLDTRAGSRSGVLEINECASFNAASRGTNSMSVRP